MYRFAFADTQTSTLIFKADGLDFPSEMPYGSSPTLTWATTDISSCTASQSSSAAIVGWNGSVGTSGTLKVPNLTNDTTFTLICKNSSQTVTVSDSVRVPIGFLVKPSVSGIVSKEIGGKIFSGTTVFVEGKGFLLTDNKANIGSLLSYPDASLDLSSVDGKNATFTVPYLKPGTYNFWLSNWNGISELRPITISATSTPTESPAPSSVQPPSATILTTPTAVIAPTVPVQSALSCTSLARDLKYQSRDANTAGSVSLLQLFLQKNGTLNSEPTGYFGAMTLAAVKKFQIDNLISSTGFVGPLTRAKIQTLSCR